MDITVLRDELPITDREGLARMVAEGEERLADLRIAICGLLRDAEAYWLRLQRTLEEMAKMAKGADIYLYENDSVDNTPVLMSEWADRDMRVFSLSQKLGKPRWPSQRIAQRMIDMAQYRTTVQEMIRRGAEVDAVVVLDMDLADGVCLPGFASTFYHWGGFDLMAANGLAPWRGRGPYYQYDACAYRFNDWRPRSSHVVRGRVPPRGAPLVPLLSAFGGLGVYTYPAYMAGSYETDGDLEHARFHMSLHAAGFNRVFLNPNMVTKYGDK